VIAEFVQDEKAVEILKSIGVDYAQGYGIGKPHALNALLV
jgi:EAL domain-containing protein (putative c-di-GMP-specific phosphodiesterase class I)